METPYSPNLSVGYLFSRAFDVFRENIGFMVAVFVIYALLTGGGRAIDPDGWLSNLVMLAIAGPITAGAYWVSLNLIRGQAADLGDMFNAFQEFVRAFGVFLLSSILILVGFICLVIPGIYLTVALSPAMFLVMDDDLGVTDTLRKAWRMTEGYRVEIFIVGLVILGINILGVLALILGVLFTGAFSLLVFAAMYDELDRAYVVEAVEISPSV